MRNDDLRIPVAVLVQNKVGSLFAVAIEPQRRFAYRWHPFAVEPNVDYDREPTTLVEFALSETPDGVLLTITESGFDAIPETRRFASYDANSKGWGIQADLVRRYAEGLRV